MGIEFNPIKFITNTDKTESAANINQSVKLGGFGYGYKNGTEVGLIKEDRTPAYLVNHFADISGDKAIRPDGTQLNLDGVELMYDGVERPELAYSEC